MSARDLARFGALYLNGGAWQGGQIVPVGRVQESVRPISLTQEPQFNAYGYMWWVASSGETASPAHTAAMPQGSFAAAGYGGQWLIVIPAWKSVIVHLTDTDGWFGGAVLSREEKIRLFDAIIGARGGSARES